MKVIENEVLVACDCDETLIQWKEPTVPNVLTKIEFDFADKKVYLTPHQYHIDLVKMYKKRGYHVTVWSANGWEWAKQVVEKTGLTEYVDVVSSKLTKYVDDCEDPAQVLGTRVFCPDITAQPKIILPYRSRMPMVGDNEPSGMISLEDYTHLTNDNQD